MPDNEKENYFDALNDDCKLHLFSFLNTRQMLNVFQANKFNHSYDNWEAVWQQRVRQDFNMKVPEGQGPRKFYQEFYPLVAERELLCAYVRAVFNAEDVPGGAELTDYKIEKINEVFIAFQMRGEKKCIERSDAMARFFPEHFASQDYTDEVKRVYEKLFMGPVDEMLPLIEKILAGEQRQQTNEERRELEMADLMLRSIGVFALTHSFKKLFVGRLTEELAARMIEARGASMLSSAIASFNNHCVAAMLEAGIDPNVTTVQQQRAAVFDVPALYLLPKAIFNLIQLREAAHLQEEVSLISKLKESAAMAERLLSSGADPDFEITFDVQYFVRFQNEDNVRDIAKSYLNKLDKQPIATEEKVLAKKALNVIIDAPTIESAHQAAAGNYFTL